MQVNITGHHVKVTPHLRAYVLEKFDRLKKRFENMSNISVVLSIEGKKIYQKAEATVHLAGAVIFADAQTDDLYAAIDKMADRLSRQIVDHKEKIQNRHVSDD